MSKLEQKARRILSYDTVLSLLADQAVSPRAKELALAIEPKDDLFDIEPLMRQCSDAKAMMEFEKVVEELSGGNIQVEVYTDATLFTQEEEGVAVVGGDADMTLSSASWLTTGSPWVSMFTAGYVFKLRSHDQRAQRRDRQERV